MVAHRLQIWLDEHGLAEFGPNLAEQGIDRLEDLWSLEKDDLACLGIPEGYVNRLLQAMGSDDPGRLSTWDSDAVGGTEIPNTSDSIGPLVSMVSIGLKFAQLARPGAAPGRGRSRGGASGRGRSRSSDSSRSRTHETRDGPFTAIAEGAEDLLMHFQGCSKLQAFLRATRLDHLTEPLKDMGIEMYDDLLEFSQARS